MQKNEKEKKRKKKEEIFSNVLFIANVLERAAVHLVDINRSMSFQSSFVHLTALRIVNDIPTRY